MSFITDTFQKRPDLAKLFEQDEEEILRYILFLEHQVEQKQKSKSPIGDSRTTHAAPSTDPRPKTRSLRRKSGKKSGGQKGHKGHRLEPVSNPDFIVHHTVTTCPGCNHDLSSITPKGINKTQIHDLPIIKLAVTEHQAEIKECPKCKTITTATPPCEAQQPTQYGPRLAAFAVYLHVAHFTPLERTADIIETVTGQRVSEGWIDTCQERLSDRLDPFIESVTDELKKAETIHCDETGFRFAGKRFWLHVCCTTLLTLLLCHRKRGIEGTNAMGIFEKFTGTATHDHWTGYEKPNLATHQFCNEHHCRELDSVTDRDQQPWANAMKIVLYDGLELKKKYHTNNQNILPEEIAKITKRYEKCLKDGYAVTPEPPKNPLKKRGRQKRGKTLCLLDRLKNRQQDTLRFLHHKHVPWSNNLAEQAIRPMKTQQKITGGFRTETGAIEFCRIRSYLSTIIKNGINPFDAIVSALAGTPWLPPTTDETFQKKQKVA